MNKFKNILLATTAFFAFGAVANAADFNLEKISLTNKTGNSEFSTSYIDTTTYLGTTTDSKYMKFALKSDAKISKYTCGTEEVNYVYVDLSGNVYQKCDIQVGDAESEATYLVNSGNTAGYENLSVTKTESTTTTTRTVEKGDQNTTYSNKTVSLKGYQDDKNYDISIITKSGSTTTSYAVSTPTTLYENYNAESSKKYLINYQTDYKYDASTSIVTGAVILTGTSSNKIITAYSKIETVSNKINIGDKDYDYVINAAYAITPTKTYYKITASDYDKSNAYYAEITNGKMIILKQSDGTTKFAAASDDDVISINDEFCIIRDGKYYSKDYQVLSEEESTTEYIGGILMALNKAADTYTFSNGTTTLKTLATSELGNGNARLKSLEKIGDYYYLASYIPADKVSSLTTYTPVLYKMTVGSTVTKEVSIKLDSSSKTITVSGTTKLTATTEGTTSTVTWKSSDDKIATVDSNGNVTGVAVGTATITATVDGKSVTATITVEEKASTSGGSSSSSNETLPDNPHTGLAVSVVGLVGLAGAGIVVNKKKGKKFFHKI